jgi:hypothetical protein
MKNYRRPVERVLCVALSLVVSILCYRSTTAIFRLAGCANNPTEGRVPGKRDTLDVRENMPRPAKQSVVTRALSVDEESARAALEPWLAALAKADVPALVGALDLRPVPTLSDPPPAPDYLQAHRLEAPGSPLAPPV